jgi:hypothetical protein
MEEKLRGRPYLLFEEEDQAYITNGYGYSEILSKEKVKEIIDKLNEFFLRTNEEDIENHNKKTRERFENEMNLCKGQATEKIQLKGSIYLLECGGKYKIGISKNVDRRIKELDNRPFKVNKIISKDNVIDVYSKEQKLHTKYSKKRIDGEWYEFNQEELKNIIDEIRGL